MLFQRKSFGVKKDETVDLCAKPVAILCDWSLATLLHGLAAIFHHFPKHFYRISKRWPRPLNRLNSTKQLDKLPFLKRTQLTPFVTRGIQKSTSGRHFPPSAAITKQDKAPLYSHNSPTFLFLSVCFSFLCMYNISTPTNNKRHFLLLLLLTDR